jgi:single-stranded-DNA-specific exonuclease
MKAQAEAFLGVEKSLKGRAWRARPFDNRMAAAISQQLELPEIIGRVLAARGQTTETAASFLQPSLKADLPDPSLIMDMERAVARILKALVAGEKIAVFGDYDVDGATSSALLKRYFAAIGSELTLYIPDRLTEGYGPNQKALLGLHQAGVGLVITVDCGILSFEPLKAASKAGLDVIVADHHIADPELPDAVAVINPNRLDDESGLGQLAAVGVVFMLLVALNRRLRAEGWFGGDLKEPDLMALLDIVALGTICDMVPLTGPNRVLVIQGLKVMAGRANAGLRALSDVAGIDEKPNAYHAGFLLGPRVNAGGRVGEAGLGARLLSSEDIGECQEIAKRLDQYNSERKEIETRVQIEAMAKAEALIGPAGLAGPAIVVCGDDWHPGVIGIVASRLKDRFNRPCFVLAKVGGEAKGSGRSITGVDLGNAVIEARHRGLLLAGGGHRMAAGLTIASDKIEEFGAFLGEWLRDDVNAATRNPAYHIDGVLSVGGATATLVDAVEAAGPFGPGNPGVKFVIADARIVRADIVGENHVRLILQGGEGANIKAIGFRMADDAIGQTLLNGGGRSFHLAGKLKRDDWQGGDKVELVLDDAAPA